MDYVSELPGIRADIQDAGRPVRIGRRSDAVNAADPLGPPLLAAEETQTYAVFVPITGMQRWGMAMDRAEGLRMADATCVLAPPESDPTPDQCHYLKDGETTYEIVAAEIFQPGDTPLLYYLGLSRSR